MANIDRGALGVAGTGSWSQRTGALDNAAFASAHFVLGYDRHREGDHAAAVPLLTAACSFWRLAAAHFPDHLVPLAEALYALGQAHCEMGRDALGAAALEEAVSVCRFLTVLSPVQFGVALSHALFALATARAHLDARSGVKKTEKEAQRLVNRSARAREGQLLLQARLDEAEVWGRAHQRDGPVIGAHLAPHYPHNLQVFSDTPVDPLKSGEQYDPPPSYSEAMDTGL